MLFNEMTLSKEFFLRRIGGMLLHVSSRNVNGPLHVERVKLQLPRTIHNAGKKRLYIFFYFVLLCYIYDNTRRAIETLLALVC